MEGVKSWRVAVIKGLYSSSLDDQYRALQMLSSRDTERNDSDDETEETEMLQTQLLNKIQEILNTGTDFSFKVRALKALTPDKFGCLDRIFHLTQFITKYLLCGEEDDLPHVLACLRHHTGKTDLMSCLLTSGIVDVLCIRVMSASKDKIVEDLLSFLFQVTQSSDGVPPREALKACLLANTIVTQEDGVLAQEELQLACLKELKHFVLKKFNLEVFMQTELPQTLMDRLRTEKRPDIRLHVMDVLINVTSAEKDETKLLVKAGLLDVVAGMLQAKEYEDKTCESVFWLVANVIGDGVELRNLAILAGIEKYVVEAASAPSLSNEMQSMFAWVLGNFFRPNAEGVPIDVRRNVVQCLKLFLPPVDGIHFQTQRDALYALVFLTNPYSGTDHQGTDLMLELDVIPRVISSLQEQSLLCRKPGIKVVMNLLETGKAAAVKCLLEGGLCQTLGNILQSGEPIGLTPDIVSTLHAVATLGHCDEIFEHVPLRDLLDRMRSGNDEIKTKILEIFRMLAKEAKPEFIKTDDCRAIYDNLVSQDFTGSLFELLEEVILLFEETSKKCGFPLIEEEEEIEVETAVESTETE